MTRLRQGFGGLVRHSLGEGGRRILKIFFAFWIMPPWGLWLLYQDNVLSVTGKIRVLLYALIIPILALLAYTLWGTNEALKGFGL